MFARCLLGFRNEIKAEFSANLNCDAIDILTDSLRDTDAFQNTQPVEAEGMLSYETKRMRRAMTSDSNIKDLVLLILTIAAKPDASRA